jgi:hypothetical protein
MRQACEDLMRSLALLCQILLAKRPALCLLKDFQHPCDLLRTQRLLLLIDSSQKRLVLG